jgi:Domain of Unknown Function (DUF1080)
MKNLSRRKIIAATTIFGACATAGSRFAWPAAREQQIDLTNFSNGWESVAGRWSVDEVQGASRNGRALVQRATDNEFNVIVAPGGPYTDVDISVRFRPISGSEDASGGIVFRFVDGRYYVIRANALEDNFRLYYYDRGRYMLTSASIKAPMLGDWHTLRVTAEKDNIRGWLNGQPLINHRDNRFAAGRIGLWTKADSITAFDSLVVVPKGAD